LRRQRLLQFLTQLFELFDLSFFAGLQILKGRFGFSELLAEHANGSVGNLMYLTQGGAKVPKESVEVFGGGGTAQLNNFETLKFFERSKVEQVRVARDKGQANQLAAFVDAVRTGSPMPISLESLFDTTLTGLASVYSLQTASFVDMEGFFSFEQE